jgi:hypothetical protein
LSGVIKAPGHHGIDPQVLSINRGDAIGQKINRRHLTRAQHPAHFNRR